MPAKARKPMVRVQTAASWRLDEIYRYTRERWGEQQAERYIRGLFAAFEGIASGQTRSRRVPPELGVQGFCFRYERHIVYWRELDGGDIGIVTVLHERMHQGTRLREDLGL